MEEERGNVKEEGEEDKFRGKGNNRMCKKNMFKIKNWFIIVVLKLLKRLYVISLFLYVVKEVFI